MNTKSNIPSIQKLHAYEKLGLLKSRRHPELPLSIFVYSEFTVYEKLWNTVTMVCRGLVVDDHGRCVVRCMPKFFNEDEPHAVCQILPNTNLTIFDKLDGSLIQVVNDEKYGIIVTSKSSFTSKQVSWATELLEGREDEFRLGLTYVFELIHPENRIVLDYGNRKELVLITVIDIVTGDELDLKSEKFDAFVKVPVVKDNERHLMGSVEGVVVKSGNLRYKVKTGEYLRLHRIITGYTEKSVWDSLRDGTEHDLLNMPEEFEKWLSATTEQLHKRYDSLLTEVTGEYTAAKALSDKEVGLSENIKHKPYVFALRNGKSIEKMLWNSVKP